MQLRRKLLETSNIKLHDALKLARAWEAADQQSRQIAQPSSDVNAVGHARARSKPQSPSTHGHMQPEQSRTFSIRSSSDSRSRLRCFNCGQHGHRSKEQSCPALGTTCGNCRKLNHFASRCCSALTRTKNKHGRGRGRGRAYQVDSTQTFEFDDEMDFAFEVSGATGKSTRIVVKVHGVDTEVLVDSGTTCNLVGLDTLRQLAMDVDIFAMLSPSPYLWWQGTPSLWNVQHGLQAQSDTRGRQSYPSTKNRRIPSRKDYCGCS